jgi:hypothetical protein
VLIPPGTFAVEGGELGIVAAGPERIEGLFLVVVRIEASVG